MCQPGLTVALATFQEAVSSETKGRRVKSPSPTLGYSMHSGGKGIHSFLKLSCAGKAHPSRDHDLWSRVKAHFNLLMSTLSCFQTFRHFFFEIWKKIIQKGN